MATDWSSTFYPATHNLLHGENPYMVVKFHNPVWALFPLIPFTLMGEYIGGIALFIFNLFTFTFAALRLKARPVAMVAFLLSPLVIFDLCIGNIDSLALVGFLFPAPIGLFFAALKPQIGIAMAIFWAYQAWRMGGLWKVALTFFPTISALALTFLLYGNWIVDKSDHLLGAAWNTSFFPWSIPVGLVLLYLAIHREKLLPSIAASPFLSPYVGFQSWSIALAGLLEYDLPMVAVVFGMWLIYIGLKFI